jgi:shikimate dehydrogenase
VLGRPIEHSRSPALHTAAYRALGLDGWRYEAVDCGAEELEPFVAGLGPEWVGLSLTMPLKRVALSVAGTVSPTAAAVGAANTLLFAAATDDGAGPVAENTDVGGIVDALGEVPDGAPAVVLGAGGTAQAALAALRDLGCAEVTALVREPSRADELAATAERLGIVLDIRRFGMAAPLLADAGVVVSTIPADAADRVTGMFATMPMPPDAVVLDAVYHPWPTPLAEAARAAGCRVASGLDMLLHQAVRQVALMTGREAPVDAMRDALTVSS